MTKKFDPAPYERLSGIFKALSHPARLAILEELTLGEACVCHLEAVLGYRQAYISQQLGVLKEAGLVDDHRESWYTFYRLNHTQTPELLAIAASILNENGHARPPRPESCPCPRCTKNSPDCCS